MLLVERPEVRKLPTTRVFRIHSGTLNFTEAYLPASTTSWPDMSFSEANPNPSFCEGGIECRELRQTTTAMMASTPTTARK